MFYIYEANEVLMFLLSCLLYALHFKLTVVIFKNNLLITGWMNNSCFSSLPSYRCLSSSHWSSLTLTPDWQYEGKIIDLFLFLHCHFFLLLWTDSSCKLTPSHAAQGQGTKPSVPWGGFVGNQNKLYWPSMVTHRECDFVNDSPV